MNLQLLRVLAPGVLISLTSFATNTTCGPLTEAATAAPGRPPGWVFGIIWFALYITTGLAWMWAAQIEFDPLFALVVGLCVVWLPVYSCFRAKRLASVVLILAAVTTGILVGCLSGASRWLMVPLLVWTTFASYLNIYDAWFIAENK